MPRSWTGITDNKIITREDLKKAVDDEYFDYKENQVIVIDSNIFKALSKTGVTSLVEVEPSTLEGRTDNQLVSKVKGRRPKEQCVKYNIKVEQSDLNSSSDGKLYVYYLICGESCPVEGDGNTSFTSYSYSGTFLSDVCVQNCPETDYYIGDKNGTPLVSPSSKLIILPGQCTSSKTVLRTLTNCPTGTTSYSYSITRPGTTILNDVIELNNDYGNFNFTISANTNNNTEIFVGNYSTGYGELYKLTGGTNNITKTIGYYSTNGDKKLDVRVFSTTTGSTFTPFDLYFTGTCASTISCQAIAEEETETYVQNVVINALYGGILVYFNKDGLQVNRTINTGSYTISECIILESLRNRPVIGTSPQQYSSPLILSNPTTYTITSTGSTCTSSTTGTTSNTYDNVEITFEAKYGFSATAFWLDCSGNKTTRFINVNEIFTTCGKYGSGSGIPVTYGLNCACYEI